MSETLKVVIPMAGFGSRLRPHTWSKPKPLIPLAGKTVLDYLIEQFNTLPDPENTEFVFIISPNQGDMIAEHMRKTYPRRKVHFVVQKEMLGQSHAIYQARQYLNGPMLMTFADTLTKADLSFVAKEDMDGVALVMPVEDPRRFGVAQVNEQGRVVRLVEKPQNFDNRLVLIGFYYFNSAEALIAAIEEQIRRNVVLKGEYFLADAINLMLEQGLSFRTEQIDTWLDAGTPDAMFETNAYLLGEGRHHVPAKLPVGVTVIPPVYIHNTCRIENAVIGPNVSLAADCTLKNVIISNSIVDSGTDLSDLILVDSLLGRNVQAHGRVAQLNMGDNSSCTM